MSAVAFTRRAGTRLPLVGALAALVSLLLLAAVTRTVVRSVAFAEIDDGLDTLAEAIGSDIELRGVEELEKDALRRGLEANTLEFRLAHHSAILCRGGEPIAHSIDLAREVTPATLAPVIGHGEEPFTAPEGFSGLRRVCRFRVTALGGRAEGATLVIFRSIEQDVKGLAALGVALGAVVLLGTLVTWAILAVAVRRSLGPVVRMTAVAREMEATDLSRRIPVAGAEEFADLATVFNSLFDRLTRAFAAQRRLVADVAHELKTPVTVIVAEAQEAAREGANEDDRRRSLEVVVDTAHALAAEVDDLLALARGDAGAANAVEPVDLEELVEDVCLDVAAGARGVEIRWESQRTVRVEGDRVALRRALSNLVANAATYGAAGGEVRVVSRIDGTVAVIEVLDRGPGIAPEDRRRVFERFVRLPAGRAEHPNGSGLGLAIVDQVARAHGGRVTIDDRPGGGAAVRLELPLPAG